MKKRGLSFRIVTNMNAAYGWGGLRSIPAFRGSIKPEPSNDGPRVIQVQTTWLPNLGETFHLYGKHGVRKCAEEESGAKQEFHPRKVNAYTNYSNCHADLPSNKKARS